MKKNLWFVCACVALLVAGIVFLVMLNRDSMEPQQGASLVDQREKQREADERREIPDNREALSGALKIPVDQIGQVGEVDRPLRDIDFESRVPKDDGVKSVAEMLPPGPQPGQAPRLTGNENPQVAGMVAEMRGQREGEQESSDRRVVTSWEEPEAFDRVAYEAGPEKYLNKIRPARVFDPAQPGEDVTPLEPISNGFHSILQGEQVVLQVKAEAGVPVAFYTPQTGWFAENQLSSVTVKADEDGVATATFQTGGGSMGIVDVLAASPVHSRQLQFRVKVDLPQQTGGNRNNE